MTCITLHIPCLPDLDLSANRRRSRHYMAQASDTRMERERALVELKAAWFPAVRGAPVEVPFRVPVSLHWTLYWPKGTRRTMEDEAGWTSRARNAGSLAAMLKPWTDAMKDLGWIVNDSPKYVPTVSYTSVPGSLRGPSMRLVIATGDRPV